MLETLMTHVYRETTTECFGSESRHDPITDVLSREMAVQAKVLFLATPLGHIEV